MTAGWWSWIAGGRKSRRLRTSRGSVCPSARVTFFCRGVLGVPASVGRTPCRWARRLCRIEASHGRSTPSPARRRRESYSSRPFGSPTRQSNRALPGRSDGNFARQWQARRRTRCCRRVKRQNKVPLLVRKSEVVRQAIIVENNSAEKTLVARRSNRAVSFNGYESLVSDLVPIQLGTLTISRNSHIDGPHLSSDQQDRSWPTKAHRSASASRRTSQARATAAGHRRGSETKAARGGNRWIDVAERQSCAREGESSIIADFAIESMSNRRPRAVEKY